jgi:hypothetical protein
MSTTAMKARLTSFAPKFLVDDLERSIGYYQKIGFGFGEQLAWFLRHGFSGRTGSSPEGSAQEPNGTPLAA